MKMTAKELSSKRQVDQSAAKGFLEFLAKTGQVRIVPPEPLAPGEKKPFGKAATVYDVPDEVTIKLI